MFAMPERCRAVSRTCHVPVENETVTIYSRSMLPGLAQSWAAAPTSLCLRTGYPMEYQSYVGQVGAPGGLTTRHPAHALSRPRKSCVVREPRPTNHQSPFTSHFSRSPSPASGSGLRALRLASSRKQQRNRRQTIRLSPQKAASNYAFDR